MASMEPCMVRRMVAHFGQPVSTLVEDYDEFWLKKKISWNVMKIYFKKYFRNFTAHELNFVKWKTYLKQIPWDWTFDRIGL